MKKWIKKLHMYTGLLNFTILVIFGIIGIVATLLPKPDQRPQPQPEVQYLDFESPEGMDDRQLADYVHAKLSLPLTGPAPDWAVRRNANNDLMVTLFTPANRYHLLVLEMEGRIRLERAPWDIWQFLFHLHELTPSWATNLDWRTRLWAYYVEFSLWSLIGMALSGVYLWLVSRPGFRWAQISLISGTSVFLLFYLMIR